MEYIIALPFILIGVAISLGLLYIIAIMIKSIIDIFEGGNYNDSDDL